MNGDGAASIVRLVDINMDDELVTSFSDVELHESDDDLLLSDEPGIIVNNSDSDNEEAELIAKEKELESLWVDYENLAEGTEIQFNNNKVFTKSKVLNNGGTNNSYICVLVENQTKKEYILKAIVLNTRTNFPYNAVKTQLMLEQRSCFLLRQFLRVPQYVVSDEVRGLVYPKFDTDLKKYIDSLSKQEKVSNEYTYTVLRWLYQICSFLYFTQTSKSLLLLDFKLNNVLIDKKDNVLYYSDNSMLIQIDELNKINYIPHGTKKLYSTTQYVLEQTHQLLLQSNCRSDGTLRVM